VVPQAPGSATDNIARLIAPELARQLGQPAVVDNRPGGALTIGIDAVAKAPPDGYTIGMGPVGALAITRHMVAKLPYDIERDLQPVALITTGYMLLAASPKLPVRSVEELIDYAKKNPGKLSNASFESTNSIAPHVVAGRVRALAVTGLKRATSLPRVPTLDEAGVPGYEVTAWTGVIAPAGLPRPVLDRLNAAVNAAISEPQAKQRLAQLGSEGGGGTPEDYAALIRRDSAKWAEVIRRSGARID